MLGYTVRRILGTIPVMVLISLLVFVLLHSAPGDPAEMLLSDEATPQDIAEAKARWGLDQPIYVQYWRFLSSAIQFDFGESFRYRETVVDLLIQRFPATIELALAAILIAVIIGVPLGVWSGARPNTWVDNVSSVVGFFGISMPSFWMGIMLILIIAGFFNWLPSAGRETFGVPGERITGLYTVDSLIRGDMRAFWDALSYLIMPAVTLGVNMLGILMRVTRSAVLDVMHEDYVTTARAKGLAERVVLWRHTVRNALITIITVVGLELGTLLSGSIIVETVFAWPGIGSMLIAGLNVRDYPLITGLVLAYTAIFVFVNFVIDICYGAIDPRIRFDR
ncbi:MAG: ABC transporter permease [Alphaproteobacteria bacterium]|nr:ABC transporter permease [Alphaproteobacteria bacterium]